jgi:hypothetical protein
MFIITITVSFCANIKFANFSLISLKFSVGSVGNRHDLEITLHEISMPLIHINLCHQVHRYGGRRGSVTLYVSDDSRGGPIINV